MFAKRGATIIDGDLIVRELQRPGTPVLAKIVERFGAGILTDRGELDRAELAGIVFPDSSALADLNEIVHPALTTEVTRRIEAERPTNHVVVLDMPLLAENPRNDLRGVVVVDADPRVARERLVNLRGMSGSDVDARMTRQATREARNAIADLIIDNSGDLEHLQKEVDRAWEWISRLPPVDSNAGELTT